MRIKILLLFLIIHLGSHAQTVTGSWYGDVDIMLDGRHNNYLAELIIKQKGDEVVGILGYYFRNGYQSVYIHGNYNKKTRYIIIDDIPITYFRAKDIDGVTCLMNFSGQLLISKVKNNLRGYFTTNHKYKYTCPELRVLFDLDTTEDNKQDSLIRNTVAKKFWQPLPQDLIVDNTPTASKADSISINATAIKNRIPQKQQATITAPSIAIVAIPTDNELLAKEHAKRKDILSNDIYVISDSIRVSFYDSGEIDGDSISVFYNKQLILSHQELAATALNIYIKLDNTKEVNELSMFAENLGLYPPNTALMVIYDGSTRQEIYLSSSLTQNATVRIRKKK